MKAPEKRWKRCLAGSWKTTWTSCWCIITAAATTRRRRSSFLDGRAISRCSRSTFLEAATYFQDALARLQEKVPANADRDRREIAIRTGLADVAIITSQVTQQLEYEHHMSRRYVSSLNGWEMRCNSSIRWWAVSVLAAFRLELEKAREVGGRLARARRPSAQITRCSSKPTAHLANILWLLGGFPRFARTLPERCIELFGLNEHLPSGKEHMRAACRFYAPLLRGHVGVSPTKGCASLKNSRCRARERSELVAIGVRSELCFDVVCMA